MHSSLRGMRPCSVEHTGCSHRATMYKNSLQSACCTLLHITLIPFTHKLIAPMAEWLSTYDNPWPLERTAFQCPELMRNFWLALLLGVSLLQPTQWYLIVAISAAQWNCVCQCAKEMCQFQYVTCAWYLLMPKWSFLHLACNFDTCQHARAEKKRENAAPVDTNYHDCGHWQQYHRPFNTNSL